MVYFSHDSLATKIGSEYDVYKTLQPDERVHLLASTYPISFLLQLRYV